MKHPDDLFERSYEAAVLDPHNPYVVDAHLPCAAAEKPITLEDKKFWTKDSHRHLENLERQGALSRTVDGEPAWFATRRNPQRFVNIRSAGESYTIFEKGDRRGPSAPLTESGHSRNVTPGLIYLHRASQYWLKRLIWTKRTLSVQRSDVKYFTRVKSEKETEILQDPSQQAQGSVSRPGRSCQGHGSGYGL